MDEQPPTVRRCAKCGEAAMLSARLWKETALLGLVETGHVRREDFVCQRCGAVFALRPTGKRLLLAAMFGVPMGCMGIMGLIGGLIAGLAEGNFGGIVLGLILLPLAAGVTRWILDPWVKLRRHPVVEGAPVPEVRFRLTEAPRRCSCGVPAPVTGIVKDTLGLERTHTCPVCQSQFTVDNALGSVMTTAVSAGVLALGAFLLTTAPGEGAVAWVISGGVALLGVGGLTVAAVRLINRLRHPVVRMTQDRPAA